MSTNYYAFRPPITSAQIVPINEGRIDINIWVNSQMAGNIICRPHEVDEVFGMLYNIHDPVVHVWFDGVEFGMGIKVIRPHDGYITNGRRVTRVKELEELVMASRLAHANMRERNVDRSEGE